MTRTVGLLEDLRACAQILVLAGMMTCEALKVMTVAPAPLREVWACNCASLVLSASLTAALMSLHDVKAVLVFIILFALLQSAIGNFYRFWWLTDDEAAARWNANEVRT